MAMQGAEEPLKGKKPGAAKKDKKTGRGKIEHPGAPKNFIASAIKHPGALHRELGVPEGQKIPAAQLAAAAKAPGKEGQRARFAMTLSKLHKG